MRSITAHCFPNEQQGVESEQRASELYAIQANCIHRRTDRWFAILMILQWIGGVVAALIFTPLEWTGSVPRVHSNVWAALIFGVFAAYPVTLAFTRPGEDDDSACHGDNTGLVLISPDPPNRWPHRNTLSCFWDSCLPQLLS